MEKRTHPGEVVRIYERILQESLAEGRYIDISPGHKLHVIEAGMGPPLVMLHGTGAASHTMVPLLEHLEGIRTIVPDLPGNGLSDPIDIGHKRYRDMAVEVTDQILNALGVDQISLAGSSGGGVWSIWYTLAHPERVHRLVLLGATPLLPGTRPPLPLRIMTAPIIGDIMARIPSNERAVLAFMGVMGEKETIINYPKMIEALVASNNDPVAAKTSRAEFSAFLNFLGFKEDMKIRADDLGKLSIPTLMIWGLEDPLGGEKVARAIRELIPNCVLELMPTGHVPWLGYPDKTAKLISDFVLSR
jgi:pimeloyl-ACP methyl ester carboxylesterase